MPRSTRDPNEVGTSVASDLAGRAMAAIDRLVDTVHDRFLRPVLLVARTVAVAFIIAICVIVLLVALGVAVMRILNVYVFPTNQWASWALLGAVSLAIGLFCWLGRHAEST